MLIIILSVEQTHLSKEPPREHSSTIVESVSNGVAIDLHRRGEHNEIVPLGHDAQKVIDVRSFMYKEAHWMLIDCHLYVSRNY